MQRYSESQIQASNNEFVEDENIKDIIRAVANYSSPRQDNDTEFYVDCLRFVMAAEGDYDYLTVEQKLAYAEVLADTIFHGGIMFALWMQQEGLVNE